jgi:hypothetical protein
MARVCYTTLSAPASIWMTSACARLALLLAWRRQSRCRSGLLRLVGEHGPGWFGSYERKADSLARCLKLDGFVVDYLPFEHELSRIVLLTCGDNCIDSGLRAPTTPRTPRNRWSKIVNNAPSHCLIQWPNWTGVFDDHGVQRDTRGDVVTQEAGLSTPADEIASPIATMPLTRESLNMKDMGDALDGAAKEGYFATPKTLLFPTVTETPAMSATSNLSTRGSEIPTPTVGSPRIPSVDGSVSSDPVSPPTDTGSPTDRSLSLVNSGSTLESLASTDSSYEVVTPPAVDAASDVATDGSNNTATAENNGNSLMHKVRRSWNRLSSSGFGAAS